MAKYKNTIQRGSVRILVFREADTWYAAALEFNIVEAGDTPREAMLLLFEAVQGYLESAKKIKARPHILNQSVEREYEEKWRGSIEAKRQPESVFFAGRMNIMSGRALVPA
jgi:predicted RNase H-like HicB family nuclease